MAGLDWEEARLDCWGWGRNKDTGGTDWIRETGLDWKVVSEYALDVSELVVVTTVGVWVGAGPGSLE